MLTDSLFWSQHILFSSQDCMMFLTASFSFFSLHDSCSSHIYSTYSCYQVVFIHLQTATL